MEKLAAAESRANRAEENARALASDAARFRAEAEAERIMRSGEEVLAASGSGSASLRARKIFFFFFFFFFFCCFCCSVHISICLIDPLKTETKHTRIFTHQNIPKYHSGMSRDALERRVLELTAQLDGLKRSHRELHGTYAVDRDARTALETSSKATEERLADTTAALAGAKAEAEALRAVVAERCVHGVGCLFFFVA
jgi:multidrug efflux pump subunit AcrA (membrane-fusion protein)